MISFSKNNSNGVWWEQTSKFWNKWCPYKFYLKDTRKMVSLLNKKELLIEKLLVITKSIYSKNILS